MTCVLCSVVYSWRCVRGHGSYKSDCAHKTEWYERARPQALYSLSGVTLSRLSRDGRRAAVTQSSERRPPSCRDTVIRGTHLNGMLLRNCSHSDSVEKLTSSCRVEQTRSVYTNPLLHTLFQHPSGRAAHPQVGSHLQPGLGDADGAAGEAGVVRAEARHDPDVSDPLLQESRGLLLAAIPVRTG